MKFCSMRNLEEFVKETTFTDAVDLILTDCQGREFIQTMRKNDRITLLSCNNYKASSGNCYAYKFDGRKFYSIHVEPSEQARALELIANRKIKKTHKHTVIEKISKFFIKIYTKWWLGQK